MNLDTLASDIILQIAGYNAGIGSREMPIWKTSLNLLAICSSWRSTAIPLVFKTAYVQSNPGSGDGLVETNDSNSLVCGTIPLIISSKLQFAVCKLCIELDSKQNLFESLNSVLDMLHADNHNWSAIKSLYLDIQYPDEANSIEYVAGCETAIQSLIAKFNNVLPNISSINSNSWSMLLDRVWLGKLVDSYAPQLKYLRSIEVLCLSAPTFSTELTYLHLYYNIRVASWLPKIFASSLKYLCLDMIPNDYSFAKFRDESSPDVHFTNLETLMVFYGSTIGQISNNYSHVGELALKPNEQCKLYFPKLNTMRMYGVPENSYILENGIFPTTMKNVQVHGATDALIHLETSNLKQVGSLCVSSDFPGIDNYGRVQFALKQLLRKVHVSANLTLKITDFKPELSLENVCWPSLTRLQSLSVIDGAMLVQLLSKLPNLEDVTAQDVRINNDWSGFVIPEASDSVTLEPFTAKLTQLYIVFDGFSTQFVELWYLKYILLRATTLRRLRGQDRRRKELIEFINEYKCAYPHLQQINTPEPESHGH